jgi:hypothetical protein
MIGVLSREGPRRPTIGSLTDRLLGSTPKLSPSRFHLDAFLDTRRDAHQPEQAGHARPVPLGVLPTDFPAQVVLADGRRWQVDAQFGHRRRTKAVKVLEFGPGQRGSGRDRGSPSPPLRCAR